MPELAGSIAQLQELRRNLVLERSTSLARRPRIGFVPTMGALHEGHASLLRRMRRECDISIASIFVNPKQFGPQEDLQRYPRTFEDDMALCEACGVELVFAPPAQEMYPAGFQTGVSLPQLSSRWCGASRPGHFEGVATVVLKLFCLVRPDVAFFGEKDYQQLRIVQQMVSDLGLALEVVGCPIVREPDGLALSSRNRYLSPEQRAIAPQLSQALASLQRRFHEGERSSAVLIETGLQLLQPNADAEGWQVEYLAVVDPHSLEPLEQAGGGARVLAAARLGPTRLIDNVSLGARA